MNNKSELYKNNNKIIRNNNMIISKSSDRVIINNQENDIRKKIINIINSNNFIYRTKVNLKIEGKILEKKIIGINGNYLITIDNEYINIDKIEDIYK